MEDQEFKTSLVYRVDPVFKKRKREVRERKMETEDFYRHVRAGQLLLKWNPNTSF